MILTQFSPSLAQLTSSTFKTKFEEIVNNMENLENNWDLRIKIWKLVNFFWKFGIKFGESEKMGNLEIWKLGEKLEI